MRRKTFLFTFLVLSLLLAACVHGGGTEGENSYILNSLMIFQNLECVLQMIFFSSHVIHLLYSITLQIQLLELYHLFQLFVFLLELFSFYVFYNFQPQLI